MKKNPDYKASITFSKGGRQLINIFSSTAFSAFLIMIIKELTDKEYKITDIQGAINDISEYFLFVVSIVSSVIRMISNYIKHGFINK